MHIKGQPAPNKILQRARGETRAKHFARGVGDFELNDTETMCEQRMWLSLNHSGLEQVS